MSKISNMDPVAADIVVIGGGLGMNHAVEDAAKGGKHFVMAIMGNKFLEFPMAASIFLANSDEHKKWLSGIPENFQVKGKNIQCV
jgi:hypothetical protein